MANAKTEIADRVRNFAINRGKDAGRKKEESEKKLVVLIIYSLFLLAYSITAMQGRETGALDPYTIYDMQLRLKKSITGTSGTPGNTSLYEVETVKDMYSYFRTTFHNAIYTATTFDGDPRFVGGGREGFLSGQMMLLGGVRISQGRSAKVSAKTSAKTSAPTLCCYSTEFSILLPVSNHPCSVRLHDQGTGWAVRGALHDKCEA